MTTESRLAYHCPGAFAIDKPTARAYRWRVPTSEIIYETASTSHSICNTICSVFDGRALGSVVCARVEDVEPLIPDGSVHLMPTDGPYYQIKDNEWDQEHRSVEAFLAWKAERYVAWRRMLAPNGTLYDFASPSLGSRVELLCGQYFNVLCNIRWAKPTGRAGAACIEDLRKPFPQSETIIMAEHHQADKVASGESQYHALLDKARGFVFESLRAYFDGERKRSGLTSPQIQDLMHASTGKRYVFDRHAFSRSQWELPTVDQYQAAREVFDTHGSPAGRPYFGRTYEDLRRTYEDLRRTYEDLRRPFSVPPSMPVVDTWTYDVVQAYEGKHECEKPAAMGRDIVLASSRPNDVVLVLFAGSGCFAAAAAAYGRRFIAVEYDERWARSTAQRCRQSAEARMLRPALATMPPQIDPRQARLFE